MASARHSIPSAKSVRKPTGVQPPADALGVTKRMSSLDDDGNQSGDATCPTCHRDGFESAQGMKRHHYYAHGESIAGVTVECAHCGTKKTVIPARADRSERHFCNIECKGAWQEGLSGADTGNWRGGEVEVTCEQCETDFTTTAFAAEQEDRDFCSRECYASWLSVHKRAERVDVRCANCGEVKTVWPSRAEIKEKHFCDRDCHVAWMSENWVGPAHPAWKGGTIQYYGPNWDEQSRKARERDDNTCQACGSPGGAVNLPVHHIRPRRKFVDEGGELDYESANELDNLVTLCQPCHLKWEGIPLRPELAD